MSLSEQKQALKSADSFFIWRSPRYGGAQGREGEREIGGGAVGMCGGLLVCASVMNGNAVKQEQTQFQAWSPRGEALGPTAKRRP